MNHFITYSSRPAVPLFICLLGGVFWTARLPAAPQSGQVTVAVGDVKFTPAGGKELAIQAGDKVSTGGTVKTGPASRAVIVITPRSAIRIAENSVLVIEEVTETTTPKKVMLDLKSGSLGALLKPSKPGEMNFNIRTPSGIAAARGTFFAVAVENGKGYAQVKEGRVEITPKGTKVDGKKKK